MMWNFEKYGNKTALIDESGQETTYLELHNACKGLASIAEGRTLSFNLCTNTRGSLLGYTAFLNAQVVPLMLDANLERELLIALIEKYKPDYLWVPHNMAFAFPEYKEVYSSWDYSLLKTPYEKAFPLFDELALLLTTSGSTGSSKFVRQSYINIQANTDSIIEYLQLNASARSITTMPMNYTYGLSIINSHLQAGASIVLTEKTLMQKEFWQQFKDFQITNFGGVPFVYEMLDRLRFARMDLPHLQTMTQAGGKLSPELHKKFAEHAQGNGKKFVVMYGQTEATARMSYLPAKVSLEKIGSIGIAIPGGKFNLIDEAGKMITEPETTGELVYQGSNVCLGYAESGTDLIKPNENKDVLHTGDLAKRDNDGFYYIVGRKKRFLKIYGNRVNLDEIEQLLKHAFPHLECACGGTDDKMNVFVSCNENNEEIKDLLVEKTGLNHAAFRILKIETIPRNEAGKVLYAELDRLSNG